MAKENSQLLFHETLSFFCLYRFYKVFLEEFFYLFEKIENSHQTVIQVICSKQPWQQFSYLFNKAVKNQQIIKYFWKNI